MTATGTRPTGAVRPAPISAALHLLRASAAVFVREVRRYTRQPVRVYGIILGPLLIFVSFGIGLGHVLSQRMVEEFDFTRYLLPGMAAMAVILPAFGSAASIVIDREVGYLRDMLVAPVSRFAIVGGKTLAGATIGLFQGLVLFLLAPLVGIGLTAGSLLQLVLATALFGLAVSALAVLVASRTERIETYTQLQNLAVNPLFFFSGATFPLHDLPVWLEIVTRINPMTYAVDALRRALPDAQQGFEPVTVGGVAIAQWAELLFVGLVALAAIAAAARVFQRMT